MRRGVNMVYIVENNGVYGLTKGQFSATADRGSKSKKGVDAVDEPIDLVALAIGLGATFVARGFSGDKAQLVPLIKAAFEHRGAAFIDVISPCVTFNNHDGSTKSFDYVREHNIARQRARRHCRPRADRDRLRRGRQAGRRDARRLGHPPAQARIRITIAATGRRPWRRSSAIAPPARSSTGLIYVNENGRELHDSLGTTARPLNELDEAELCPGSKALEAINASLR